MLPVELHRSILEHIDEDNDALHLLTVSRTWRAEAECRIYRMINIEYRSHGRKLLALKTLGENKRLALLVQTLRIDFDVLYAQAEREEDRRYDRRQDRGDEGEGEDEDEEVCTDQSVHCVVCTLPNAFSI